ncbi:hypothetical protein EYR40_011136 [Pleurotus pulmonarius]|nr:hypothetical protein EYR36_002906 [Pleurotus pulmonarius]KAF4583668.1 hypothetical protein EYR38_002423 [Pleurotus pulmonarius]KAF4587115.1 hypothetical protein EYR40_011136 [Pleurotus pulmonarius]
MTYTFFANMTPISFSAVASTHSADSNDPHQSLGSTSFAPATSMTVTPTPPTHPEAAPSAAAFDSGSPAIEDESQVASSSWMPRPSSHGKKRDASYIPRPPNAFILFRSSFIRSQQVPGKVEGNHSTLSKIIGMYWKTLPKQEREEWEQKAVDAQAEHRKRYPDWRFRPGANAMAKLKIKDGGGGGSRRRNPGGGSSKAGKFSLDFLPPATMATGEGSSSKGKGKAREVEPTSAATVESKGKGKERAKDLAPKSEKNKTKEKRVEKIVSELIEGKKGAELELAMEEWEDGRRAKRRTKTSKVVAQGREAEAVKDKGKAKAVDVEAVTTKPAGQGRYALRSRHVEISIPAPEVDDQGKLDSSSDTERGSGGTADADGEEYASGDEDAYTSIPFATDSPKLHVPTASPVSASSLTQTPQQPQASYFIFPPAGSSTLSFSRSIATTSSPTSTPTEDNRVSPELSASGATDAGSPSSEFKAVPLTSMYKRSLSAPAPDRRSPYNPTRSQSDLLASSYNRGGESNLTSQSSHLAPPPNNLPTHVRRDTVSIPVNSVGYNSPSTSEHSPALSDSHPQPLDSPSPLLPQPLGIAAQPLRVHWQGEEDRTRFEAEHHHHGYWFPPSTTHTIAERSEEGSAWRPQPYTITNTDGMGYDMPTEAQPTPTVEYVTNPYIVTTSADGSGIVDWGTSPNRAGMIAAIPDPFLSFPTSVDSESSGPTSPISPPISSFSTLTGWAGDMNMGSHSHRVAASSSSSAERKPDGGNSIWASSDWQNQIQPSHIGTFDSRSSERSPHQESIHHHVLGSGSSSSSTGPHIARGRGPRRSPRS